MTDGEREPWMNDAACANTDPELWFPNKGESTLPAKRICATCDVTEQCLRYALANNQKFGVWGGLSELERRSIRREKKADARAEVA